jgi:hypothetical protein
MKKTVMACAAVMLIAGCAARPENIPPAYVSTLSYQSLTCQQLAEESARVDTAYAEAAKKQTHARHEDTVAVALVGLPLGSMTGRNVATEVANLKGQQVAIHQTETQRNCYQTTPQRPVASR